MSKVAVVTDSTSYIPDNLLQKHHISVLPQVLIWGEQTFRDGVDIQPDEFYTRLKTAKVMPTTSQVTIGAFQEAFSRLAAEGYDILAVLVGEKLSGTLDSARQAMAMVPEARVELVDSASAAMALGFQVLAAARAADQGADLEECREMAEEAAQHTGVIFAVDTLEFLHRGGRIVPRLHELVLEADAPAPRLGEALAQALGDPLLGRWLDEDQPARRGDLSAIERAADELTPAAGDDERPPRREERAENDRDENCQAGRHARSRCRRC